MTRTSDHRKPASQKMDLLLRVARDEGLSPQASRVATVLALGYFNDEKGYAYPAIETLAGELGISDDTVGRALKALEKAGHLRIVVEPGRRTNRYLLDLASTGRGQRARPCRDSGPAGDPETPATMRGIDDGNPRTRAEYNGGETPAPMRGFDSKTPATVRQKPPHPCGPTLIQGTLLAGGALKAPPPLTEVDLPTSVDEARKVSTDLRQVAAGQRQALEAPASSFDDDALLSGWMPSLLQWFPSIDLTDPDLRTAFLRAASRADDPSHLLIGANNHVAEGSDPTVTAADLARWLDIDAWRNFPAAVLAEGGDA